MSARRSAVPLAPHEAALMACARVSLGSAAPAELEACLRRGGIDWPAFVQAAIRHGVAQTAAHELLRTESSAEVPEPIRAALHRLVIGNAARNRVLLREAGRLVAALGSAGIQSLALKGVALAVTVYPDPALRNFADIDLLVAEAEFERACRVAKECGYSPSATPDREAHHAELVTDCGEDILSDTLVPEFEPLHAPERMARFRERVSVEIHRAPFVLASGLVRRVDLAPFWQGAYEIHLDGTAIRIPGPEVMVCHLAAHAASHDYRRLLFPLDVAFLLRRHGAGLPWDRVLELAEQFGVRAEVWRMLGFVRAELGGSVPDEVMALLCSGHSIAPLTAAEVFGADRLDPAAATMRRWLASGSASERWRAARQVVFPPPHKMRRIYPSRSRVPLAALYAARPFHLLGRGLASIRAAAQKREGEAC